MREEEATRAKDRFLKLELEMQRAKSEYESLLYTAEQAQHIVRIFSIDDDFDMSEIYNI